MSNNAINKSADCKEHKDSLKSKKTRILMKLSGPIIILVLALLHDALHFYGHEIPDTTGIFAIVIIYSILTDGLGSGIAAAFISLAYSGFHAYTNTFKNYTHIYEFLIHPGNTIIFLGIAILAGIKYRQVNKYLNESEQRERKYRTLFDNANDMVFLVEVCSDGAFGKVIEANDKACEALGYSREELLSLTPFDLSIDEQPDRLNKISKELLIKGHMYYEEVLQTKSGNKLAVESHSTCFVQDSRNLMLAIIRDVSERREIERKLRESEEFNHTLIELSPDGMLIYKGEKLVYANTALLKMIKASSLDDVLGIPLIKFIHPDCQNEASKQAYEILTGSSDLSVIEAQLVALDGTIVDVEIAGTLIFLSGERMVYSAIRDITLRKQAEKKLVESEKKYKMLFNNVKDAIFVHEVSPSILDNKYIEVNDSACTMLEYSKEELLAMSPRLIVDPSSINIIDLNTLISKGQNTFECIMSTKTGKLIFVEISSSLMHLSDRVFVLSVVRDTTEKKQAEMRLSQSREQYLKLVELCPDAIFTHKDGIFTFANIAGVQLLKASSSSDIVGRKVLDIIHKDCHSIVKERLNSINTQSIQQPLCEQKLICLDGSIADVEVASAPILGEDGISVIGVVRDISEKKKAMNLQKTVEEKNRVLAETLELDRIRTEFFANLSHELRTPLTMIHTTMQVFEGYLHSKLSVHSDPSVQKYLGIIRQNTFRLLRLINNLIDITKMDAGFMEFNAGNYNIVSLVEDITLSAAGFIEEKGLTIQFDTDNEDITVRCDPDKIERVILNLVSNAVKFTDKGGSIYVNIWDKTDRVMIAVQDTGIGIPKDKQDIIFDRFRQVNKSLTRTQEGSGIGLSIVKSIVEMHEGKITLESEPGKGSKFIIELPSLKHEAIYEDYADDSTVQQKRKIDIIEVEFSDIYR